MIEVRGVNTHNKGAHLMMLAIDDAIGARTKLTVSPNGSRYADRARAGYHQTVILNQAPRLTSLLGNVLPRGARNAFGLASEASLTGVLDASGFAYSDSFSAVRPRREAQLARRWKHRQMPLVFLPQAFGPFTKSDQRRWSKELLDGASIVYARDRQSADYLSGLRVSAKVELAPDFTVGLDVSSIPRQIEDRYGAIVPNEKLVTQGRVDLEEYVQALVCVAEEMRAAGLKPIVVIHEFNDTRIAESVAELTSSTVFKSASPLVLKRVLGDAEVAIASRFHAIVSALSLNTPVGALGWSHKYVELMSDFGVPDWVIANAGEAAARTRDILATPEGTKAELHRRVANIKQLNAEMWQNVLELITK